MDGRIVIVAYKPRPGKSAALSELMMTHWNELAGQRLVTDRAPITMCAADGTFVEVFEWKSSEAMRAAHENPAVLAMWARYAEACEYVPVASVAEASRLFSEFTPMAT